METMDRCLHVLKTSNSDSEKLAVLVVLAKICETLTLEINQNTELFEAITSSFLRRLLNNNTKSTNSDDIQVIGINIISFFARTNSELLIKDEVLLENVLNVFTEHEKTENDRLLYTESVDIILNISDSDLGAEFLVKRNIFTILKDQVINTDLRQKVITIYQNVLCRCVELNVNFISSAVELSYSFVENQELLKFEYLQIISDIVQMMTKSEFMIMSDYTKVRLSPFLHNVTLACKDIMKSHVKPNIKQSVLLLLSNLTKVCGKDWLFTEESVGDVKSTVELILTVVLVELSFSLNNEPLNDEEDEEKNDNIENVNNGLSIQKGEQTKDGCIDAAIHLAISVLSFICSDSFEVHVLVTDFSFISNIFNILQNIMRAVFDFLIKLDHEDTNILSRSSVVSAISMLSIWITEETENLREELVNILPFITKLLRKDLENIQKQSQQPVILDIMLPGILQIIPEKKMRSILLSYECHDTYIQYITMVIAESAISNVEILEALFHMVHQFSILEPTKCFENSSFKSFSSSLLDFTKTPQHMLQLSEYSQLELIAIVMIFIQHYRIEYNESLERTLKNSIEILIKLTDNIDEETPEMWFIAMQHISATFKQYQKSVKPLIDEICMKDWTSVVGDKKAVIDVLLSQLPVS